MSEILAILPKPTTETAPFWEGCDRGELLLRRCEACGERSYYPRRLCPHCGSERLAWERAAGRGTVYSHSEICISFYGGAWESQLPYTVVLVDLDEGPRMLSRLVPGSPPARTGSRVALEFVEVEGRKLPYFTVLEPSGETGR